MASVRELDIVLVKFWSTLAADELLTKCINLGISIRTTVRDVVNTLDNAGNGDAITE